MAIGLLEQVRRRAGLTVTELARKAATSRPTLSAYEHGRVSPTLETFERIMLAAGYRLQAVRMPVWREVPVGRGRTAYVADELPRLSTGHALGTVLLPIHLEWSRRDRTVDLADRAQRLRAFEAILREGRPADIERYVDGVLLVEGWTDLVLPRELRRAWQPVIDRVQGRD